MIVDGSGLRGAPYEEPARVWKRKGLKETGKEKKKKRNYH
jgi:hypothetical protein